MRMFAGAALAAALIGAASVAFAADATGAIKSLDTSKDMITLDNGSSYMAPKSVKTFRLQGRRESHGELHQVRRQDGRNVDQACDLMAATAFGAA